MYEKRNLQRLELISDKLNKIFNICSIGIIKALEDETRDRPAILMHLVACNEQLQKIQDSGDNEILSIFTSNDIKGLRGVRNATAHDYEGIDLFIIEDIIKDYLPPLKERIDAFLNLNLSHNKIDFTSKFNEFIENKNNQDKEEKSIHRQR